MIWKKHPNFPDYEISEVGTIKRAVNSRAYHKAGDIVHGRVLKSGYRQFKLKDKLGKKRLIRANRLVAETFIGPAPSTKHQAAHNDGNKLNNRIQNLRWATPKENQNDKLLHGTVMRGSRIGTARLTEDKVIEIRAKWTDKRGQLTALARFYGAGVTTIRRIINFETWAHVSRSALDQKNARQERI